MLSALAFAFYLLSGQTVPAPAKTVSMKASATAPPTYSSEAYVVEQSDKVFRYNKDGTGTQTHHFRVKVQNDAGVHDFSVISTPFASSSQSARVDSLTVTHADGSVSVTPPADTMTMPATVTQQAPIYSDLDVLQTPVRGLRPGDTVDYKITITQFKAEAPGEFWDGADFMKDSVVLSQTVILDVPNGKPTHIWNPDHPPKVARNGGRIRYQWTFHQLAPTSSQAKKPAVPDDRKPDLLWTTFASWKEFGQWYGGLAAPQMTPTSSIRAEADALTQDAKSPEDQVKAIYTFVATHIRYVGIDFGIGRFQPHPAAEVLANQYGDCKDKDTLLEALLRAKGFTTAPALVGVALAAIPDIPTPTQFNHVITTVQLPSGQIWLDSTPAVAPYRLLTAPVRDKEALVIPSLGDAKLERTPASPPYAFENQFLAEGVLTADGAMQAHITITDRSDAELVLRAFAMSFPPAQWDDATQYLARMYGFGGKTSQSDFGRADDLSVPMKVTYVYTRKPYGDWDNHRVLPLFPTIGLPAAPDEEPKSPLKLGALRTDTAITRIQLPVGFHAELPNAIHVMTSFASFDQTYEVVDRSLTIRRKVVVRATKLPAADWQQYQKFTKDVSLNSLPYIPLTQPNTSKANSGQSSEALGNPAAAELIQEAWKLEKGNDYADAEKRLDEAKAIHANQPYLWSSYGYVAFKKGNPGLADRDYRKEIALHPTETFAVNFDAWLLHTMHKDPEAEALLQAGLEKSPTDPTLVFRLAGLQANNDIPAAITTLRKATEAAPENAFFSIELAKFLRRTHQSKEAVQLLEKTLRSTQDPLALNNASYELAKTGVDLPLAEKSSRQSIEILTAQSTTDIAAVNQTVFRQAQTLIPAWDTLGYILMKEKELDAAQDYLHASWRNTPTPTDGLHYGNALEKLGRKREALRVEQLSRNDAIQDTADGDRNKLNDSINRLKREAIPQSAGDRLQQLQDLRTFHVRIDKAAPTFRYANFRLQLQSTGVHNSLRVSGDASLGNLATPIRNLQMPHFVPSRSSAYLVRDAIVTCSADATVCDLVLMPVGDISAEQNQQN